MEGDLLVPAGLVKIRAAGQRGAGWAIGDTGVLTARHNLVESPAARPGQCWAIPDPSPSAPGFECEVVFEDRDRDLALLRVLDAGALAWRSRPGAGRTVLAEPGSRALEVEVIGFPEATLDEWPHPEAITATLLPGGGAGSGRMPLDVTSSVPQTPLAWKGMSGAGVRDRANRLVGIVVDVSEGRQQRRLYAAILPNPDVDGAFAAALRRVGAAELVEDARAPEANRLLELVDQRGRPYTPQKLPGLDRLGVRFARSDIIRGRENRYYPYTRRLVDRTLDDALGARTTGSDTRVLLLEGDAMAGKSRSLAEAVRRHRTASTWLLLKPRAGAPLDEVIGFAGGSNALVWLDDHLEEHLGSVSTDQFRRLLRPGLAVVATIRRDQLAHLRDSDFTTPRNIVDDSTLTQRIVLRADLEAQERLWLQDLDPESELVRALEDGQPLGEALCAAREMIRRLENPPGDHYPALADLIIDWPDTGIATPLPEAAAVFLWSFYLADTGSRRLARMSGDDLKAEYEKVRDWLCKPVAGPDTAIVKRRDGGLVIDDLFRQRRSCERVAIPREVFEVALTAAGQNIDPDPVMLNIAARAAAEGWTSITPGTRNPFTEAGEQEAGSRWKAVADLARNPAHIVVRAPGTVHAGTAIKVLVAGRMLKTTEIEGARVYADCIIKYTCWRARAISIDVKGKTYPVPIPETNTVTTRRRVGVHEFLRSGRISVGQAFAELAEIPIPADAIRAMQTKAVEASWEIAAELLTKGRSARAAFPVSVIPAVRSIPADPVVTGEKVAALSFSGLPDGPLYQGDKFHGKLRIIAKHDLVARAITVKLILRVRVNLKNGYRTKFVYPVHDLEENRQLHQGVPVEIAFSGTVPSPAPAVSVESHHVGDPADDFMGILPPRLRKTPGERVSFSAQWCLEGAVLRRRATKATVKQNVTVASERLSGLPSPGQRQPSRDRQRTAQPRARRGEEREALRRRLVALMTSSEPRQDGGSLAGALTDLFAIEGIRVTDGFAASDITQNQMEALADADGQLFLVAIGWQEEPLDVSDVSGHLVRVYGHQDLNGLMISVGGYTQHALAECRRALVNRVVILAEIQELLFLLERDGDVRTWLAAKLHAAKAEGNPFYLPIPGQS